MKSDPSKPRTLLTTAYSINKALREGQIVFATVVKFGEQIFPVYRARQGKVVKDGGLQVELLEGWQYPSQVWHEGPTDHDHEDDQTRGPQERSFL